jgi:hypothetical protein
VISSPSVTDDTLYVGSKNGEVFALDRASGTEKWVFDTGYKVRSSPAVVGGVVYIGSGDGNIYAIDSNDGTERWAFDAADYVDTSPAVVGGRLYAASRTGRLYALAGTSTNSPAPASSTAPPESTPDAGGSTPADGGGRDLSMESQAESTARGTPSEGSDGLLWLVIIGGSVVGAVLGLAGLGVAAAVYRLRGRSRTTGQTREGPSDEALTEDAAAPTDTTEEAAVDLSAPGEVVAEAEESARAARDARDAGDYGQAAEALETAIEQFERLASSDADVEVDPGSRLEELRHRRRELQTVQSTVADIEERLTTAEQRLATADEAFDDGDEVVARLRYRQARDIYEDVLTRLEKEGLEDVPVSGGGRRFEGSEDIEQRRQAAVDGFELTT